MAGLFQGDPLPAITKTTESQQTAPEFYTNYLQDIANLGQNAVQQGGVAGFSPLQQQAFQMAPDLSFAGSGSMGAASQLMGEAGATTAPDVVADYMNPYQSAVVDEMGRLTQRNIQENVLPNLGAAATGSGQFGSRRQQQITGNTLRDIQADLLGKQYGALSTGYTNATTAAQNDLNRALQAGQGFENLGTAQQNLANTGLKTMYDYGTQQQAQGQKMLDYPMAQTQQFAKLLQGYTMPMGTTGQTTGSEGYSNSPLSQIAGLGSMFAALYPQNTSQNDYYKLLTDQLAQKNTPPTPPYDPILNTGIPTPQSGNLNGGTYAQGGAIGMPESNAPAGASYHDGNGNFYDADGYLVTG